MTREEAIRIVDLWVTKKISQEKRDELVEMVLRNGPEAFKRSSLLKEINKGNGWRVSEKPCKWP